MIQSAMAPEALWKLLGATHCKRFGIHEARVLSLVSQGYTNNEIACLMGMTPGTVRRHIMDMCQRVFQATEIPQERDKLGAWVDPHLECCIPLVQEMIENDRKIVENGPKSA